MPDSVERLSLEMERRGLERAVVVTGRTLGASGLLERVTGPLGSRCVAVFTAARQHVPSCSVAELAKLLEQHHADTIISFGGGSPIDTAKAAVYTLLAGERVSGRGKAAGAHRDPDDALGGRVHGGRRHHRRDRRASSGRSPTRGSRPRTVIADPTLTLETPALAVGGVRHPRARSCRSSRSIRSGTIR